MSEQAETDLEHLVDAALPFAARLLGEYGEMYPFAMSLDLDGDVVALAVDMDGEEDPAPADVLARLREAAAFRREELRAVLFASDVLMGEQSAVRLDLEHRDGPALITAFPYERSAEGAISLGEHAVAERPAEIWT